MIVADANVSLVLTGTRRRAGAGERRHGHRLRRQYALGLRARACSMEPLDAEAIVRKSLDIAAEICVFTNRNVTIETLKSA